MKHTRINVFYFIIGILAVTLTCMTGTITNMNGRNYSVAEIAFSVSSQNSTRYSWYTAFTAGLNSWIILLLPILVAIPTIPIFLDEQYTSFYRFSIGRIGLYNYIKRSYFRVILCGGLLIGMGLIIYALFTKCMFPIDAKYGALKAVGIQDSLLIQVKNMFILILQMMLWGAAMSSCAWTFAGIFSSKYVVLSLPFLLNYIMQNIFLNHVVASSFFFLILSIAVGFQIWKYRVREVGI